MLTAVQLVKTLAILRIAATVSAPHYGAKLQEIVSLARALGHTRVRNSTVT